MQPEHLIRLYPQNSANQRRVRVLVTRPDGTRFGREVWSRLVARERLVAKIEELLTAFPVVPGTEGLTRSDAHFWAQPR